MQSCRSIGGWCVVLSTLVGLGYCVPSVIGLETCTDLDVFASAGIVNPTRGDDLRYCTTSSPQCCSSAYFASLKDALTQDLSSGAVRDLRPVLDYWRETFDLSEDTLDEFLTDFFLHMPIPTDLRILLADYLDEQEAILRSQLSPEFDVNLDFDFVSFVENITILLVDTFAESIQLMGITPDKAACVHGVLLEHLANISDVLVAIENHLSQLQLIYQTMSKINMYMGSVNSSRELNYRPSEQCLEAVLSLGCPSCVRNIPLPCQTMCGPVVAGCQAPLHDSLAGQFDAIWNVSRQVASLAKKYMNQTLRVELPSILSTPVLFNEVSPRSEQLCGVSLVSFLTEKRKRFVSSIALPPSLGKWVTHSTLLQGTLTYDPVPNFCANRSSPIGCWNGTQILQDGSVAAGELGMGICDQEAGQPFDISQLHQQAAEIGTPVLDFLETVDLAQTLPRGVDMPKVPPMKFSSTSSPNTTLGNNNPNGAVAHRPAHWLLWLTLTLSVLIVLDKTRSR